MRFGILGSSGDPWHRRHLAVGVQGKEQFNLDWVYLLPAGQPVGKPNATNKDIRWQLTLAIANKNPKFRASRLEIDREGPSYMVDTLRELRRIHGSQAEMFLIIGEDRAPNVVTWHEATELVKMCTILVAPRGSRKLDPKWVESVLPPGSHFGIIEIDDSSSFIRKQIAEGKAVDYLVDDDELTIIQQHGLYKQNAPVVSLTAGQSSSAPAA
jgi:nicotinate-nucleotide adenylyltransferase